MSLSIAIRIADCGLCSRRMPSELASGVLRWQPEQQDQDAGQEKCSAMMCFMILGFRHALLDFV